MRSESRPGPPLVAAQVDSPIRVENQSLMLQHALLEPFHPRFNSAQSEMIARFMDEFPVGSEAGWPDERLSHE